MHKMARILLVAAAIVLAMLPQFAGAQASDRHGQDLRKIANKLQCPVCEGTSVADSRSRIAVDMRAVIETKLKAGELETEILAFFVERYGPGILRQPPTTGFYSVLWWLPVAFLAVGAGGVLLISRRRKRPAAAAAVTAIPGPEMEAYRRRLKDLEGTHS